MIAPQSWSIAVVQKSNSWTTVPAQLAVGVTILVDAVIILRFVGMSWSVTVEQFRQKVVCKIGCTVRLAALLDGIHAWE